MANTNENQQAARPEFQPINIHVLKVQVPDPSDPSKNYFEAVFDGQQGNPDAQIFRVRMNTSDDPVLGVSMEKRISAAAKGGGRTPCSYIDASSEKNIRQYVGKSFVVEKATWNPIDGCYEGRWLKRLGADPAKVITGVAVAEIRQDARYDNRLRMGMLHFLGNALPVTNPQVAQYLHDAADFHYARKTMPRGVFDDKDREINVTGQQSFGVILVARDAQGQVIDYTGIQIKRTPSDDSEYPAHYTDDMKYYKDRKGQMHRQSLPLDGQHLINIVADYQSHAAHTYGEGAVEVLAIPVNSYPGSLSSAPLSLLPFDRSRMTLSPIEALHKNAGYTCGSLSDLPVDQNNQVQIGGKVNSAIYSLAPFDATYRMTQDQAEGVQNFINGSNLTISYPLKDEHGLIKHPIECVKGPDGQPLQLHPALRGLVVGRDRANNYTVAGYQQTFDEQHAQEMAAIQQQARVAFQAFQKPEQQAAQQQAAAQQPAAQAPYNPALDHAANVAPLDPINPNDMLKELDAAAGSAREQAAALQAAAPMEGEYLPNQAAQAPAAQRPVYNNSGPGA